LFLAGDKGDGCYRVEEGLLKASVGAPNGSERILGILGPGSVVGELSMIDGAPRSASVTALRDSKLYFVSQADFDAIGKSLPRRDEDLAQRLRDTNDALAARGMATPRFLNSFHVVGLDRRGAVVRNAPHVTAHVLWTYVLDEYRLAAG
jgi:CRP-like cAMP-binding protein